MTRRGTNKHHNLQIIHQQIKTTTTYIQGHTHLSSGESSNVNLLRKVKHTAKSSESEEINPRIEVLLRRRFCSMSETVSPRTPN